MKIGICGGTFDPFHRGHLDPVLAVRDEMEWERILYIPAFQQPFKTHLGSTSGYHRFAMAVLATAAQDGMLVSPWELERATVSYTVDTLESMRQQYPQATLDWIVGDDNIARLDEWRNLPRIFELANFTILTRIADRSSPAFSALASNPVLGGRVLEARKRGQAGGVVFAHNPIAEVSSTEIRRRVRAGEPIDSLVHPAVARYIENNGLYREEYS
jgi:nicotinate-nucleotide adenylyltransferase